MFMSRDNRVIDCDMRGTIVWVAESGQVVKQQLELQTDMNEWYTESDDKIVLTRVNLCNMTSMWRFVYVNTRWLL